MEQQQQPSSSRRRRTRGRGGPEAQGTATGRVGRTSTGRARDDGSSSTIAARWTPFPMASPVYTITVDPQGSFHVSPSVGRGGPFRSVGEAFAATRAASARARRVAYLWVSSWRGVPPPAGPVARIYTRRVELQPETATPSPWSSWEYHVTLRDGLFYPHPPDVGGPFHSLGEAAASIKDHNTWASSVTQLLTRDYYLTLKDGIFHVHPNNYGIGGPFKHLGDAARAIRFYHDWRQGRKERNHKVKEFLDNLDPAVYIARIKDLTEAIRSGKRDPESEPMNDVASLESEDYDPEVSEAIDRMERFIERRNAIRNGMKWMQSEVLEAFEFYKASTGYQGPNYEFVKLDQQCLIYDTFSKPYHHYNFTMKKKSSFYLSKKAKRSLKKPSTRACDYQLFFAEVKSTEEGKQIICCPVGSGENGHCFGCRNVGIDLRHPESGGYEEGHEESGFPFDSDSASDD